MTEPLDLEPIRRRFEHSGEQAPNSTTWANRLFASSADVPALIAEIERLRELVPPLLLCQGGETVQVTDMGAWLRAGGFGGSREPFGVSVDLDTEDHHD